MPCPICRKEFTVPKEGWTGLQKNFFMERLVEMEKISEPSKKTLCNFCLADYDDSSGVEIPLATTSCLDCHENLCEDCSRHHRKQRLSREHQIVELGSQVIVKRPSPMISCGQHKGEQLKLFCNECKSLVCVLCFVEGHKSHNCSDVQKVADEFRKQIEQDLCVLGHCTSESQLKMANLDQERNRFVSEIQDTERVIIRRSEELKRLVTQHTQTLIKELAERKQQTLKKLDCDEKETQTHLSIVDSFMTYSEELMLKGSASDICRSAHDLKARAGELQQIHESQVRRQIPSVKISFKTTALDEILKTARTNNNIVGIING